MKSLQVFVATILLCCCSSSDAVVPAVDIQPRHHHHNGLRLCVPDIYYDLCKQMIDTKNPGLGRHDENKIVCVSAPDKISCIDRIIKGDADWMILDPEELYIAYRYLPNNGVVVTSEIRSAEYSNRDYRYAPVAVVRASSGINGVSDLKGKRSCHTGFGRNAGWKVPFSHLFTKGELKCTNDSLTAIEKDLTTVSGYFGPACVPGQWDPVKSRDTVLKSKYRQLCQLCKNPDLCSQEDSYAGYDGALRCITENNGDVAWTKYDAVQAFFRLNESTPLDITGQYELLCRDGSRQPLNSDKPCTWAKRPWRTVVITNHHSGNYHLLEEFQAEFTRLRKQAQATKPVPEWLTKVLDFYEETDVEYHYSPYKVKTLTPQAYLRPTNFSETLWHPSCGITEKSLKICVFNQVELQRCNSLKLAALAQRISPGFSCVLGTCTGHCSRLLAKGEADLIVADAYGADRIESYTELKEKPLISILRGLEKAGDAQVPYRYALAVITEAIAGEFQGNLKPLKGKRSCHGSVYSLAGFNVPLSVLRDAGEITGENCALPVELSKYFSKSCLPGASDAKRRFTGLSEEPLCSLCAGDGETVGKAHTPETVCSDSPNERYYGSDGALRCLTENVSDVSFIDHLSLLKKLGRVTKDHFPAKLLCRNGTVTDLENYRQCHWGTIPTQKIITRAGEQDAILRKNFCLSASRAQELFRPGGKDERIFKLFGTYYGTSDVIFQDSLVGFTKEMKPEEREQEKKLIRDFNSCRAESKGAVHRSSEEDEWKPKEQV